MIELEFDNSVVKYENLVDYFFEHHDPTAPHKVQYRSLILYIDDQQKEAAERALEQIKVSRLLLFVLKYNDLFLYRKSKVMSKLELRNSTCSIKLSITTKSVSLCFA